MSAVYMSILLLLLPNNSSPFRNLIVLELSYFKFESDTLAVRKTLDTKCVLKSVVF